MKCEKRDCCMGDSADLLGIVTVTFNSAAVIDGFLESLLLQDFSSFRLYLVDNASTDDTLRRVANFEDDRIVVCHNQCNVGVAEGNNIGIRAALADDCRFVLLINNDTEFSPNLVSELIAGIRK